MKRELLFGGGIWTLPDLIHLQGGLGVDFATLGERIKDPLTKQDVVVMYTKLQRGEQ
jgi:hypothetical protein